MNGTGSVLFTEKDIGDLTIKNRFIRASTSESMATDRGGVTEDLIDLYEELARGGVGLIMTGHLYTHARGKYYYNQTGVHVDRLIPGLSKLVDAVHQADGRVFAQLSHAGSQSRIAGNRPLAPSPVKNEISGNTPEEMTENQIWETIDAFGSAARRAVDAGFDGIHLHGGHGYLISEFSSPHANRRTDAWGGDPHRRGRFLREVYQAVRDAAGPDMPITLKLGITDATPDGLEEKEGVERAVEMEELGVDALEISKGVITGITDTARKYVAVDRKRAIQDRLYHRIFDEPEEEAYFQDFARVVRSRVDVPVILVGGLRSRTKMEEVVSGGSADFLSMARPFIREPDLVRRFASGQEIAACTSCNICAMHEGKEPLQCWRKSWSRLLDHAWKYYVRDRIKKRTH